MSPRVPNMLSVNAEHEITKLGVIMESVASSVKLMAEGFGATNEKLDRLASNVEVLTSSVADLHVHTRIIRTDVAVLKTDVAVLKTDVAVLKTDVVVLKDDVRVVKRDIRGIRGVLSMDDPPPKKPRARR